MFFGKEKKGEKKEEKTKRVKSGREARQVNERGRGVGKNFNKKWEDRVLGRGRGGRKRSEAGRLMIIPRHVTMIEWRDRAALSRMPTVPSCLRVPVLVQITAREERT